MGPERRLHPLSFLFSMGQHLTSLLLPGVALFFTAGSRGDRWELWLTVLIVPYTIAALARSLSYRYRFADEEMVVRKGWIFRSERHIPYARIQNIDAIQTVFHRLAGVAEVRVETAAGGEPEATMTVLPVAAMEEMRGFVFAARQEPAPAAGPRATDVPAADGDVMLRLPAREVLLYGLVESRGAVVLAGGLGVLWELGLFERFFERAANGATGGSVLRQLARSAFSQAGGPTLDAAAQTIAAFVGLILVLRVLSMAWAFVRLYGFTLRRADNDLRFEYGLLTRVSGTVPQRRIQTLTVSGSPLHRLFRRASIHVDTAGGDGGEARRTRREPIAPLVHEGDVAGILAALLPEVNLAAVAWQPCDPRAVRRVRFRGAVLSGLVCLPLAFALRAWAIAVLVPFAWWMWFYATKYVAALGWALERDAVVYRRGWLWPQVTVARFSKVQVVTREETPFDRRTGMARVAVDTAGADGNRRIEIPFLPAATATWLAAALGAAAARTAFRW